MSSEMLIEVSQTCSKLVFGREVLIGGRLSDSRVGEMGWGENCVLEGQMYLMLQTGVIQ